MESLPSICDMISKHVEPSEVSRNDFVPILLKESCINFIKEKWGGGGAPDRFPITFVFDCVKT